MKDATNKITNTLLETPIGFTLDKEHYYIYPLTLGGMLHQAQLIQQLGMNPDLLRGVPVFELTRIATENKIGAAKIIALSTFQGKAPARELEKRAKLIAKETTNEEIATFIMLIISQDDVPEITRMSGIDREQDKQRQLSKIKDSRNVITTGGVTLYGSLIAPTAEKFGWTLDYILWGISYNNLRLLLADAPITTMLTDDERKKVHFSTSRGQETINAEDPANRERIINILKG